MHSAWRAIGLGLGAVLASFCSGAPWSIEDASVEYETDVVERIEPWDGPESLLVYFWDSTNYDTDKILVTDHEGGAVFLNQPGDRIVYATRITKDGDLPWGPDGVHATGQGAYDWIGMKKGLERGALADGEGGVYVLYRRFHLDEYFIMGNHVFADGSLLYPDEERAVHGPYDDIEDKSLGNSVVLGDRLILGSFIFDVDFILAHDLKNFCPIYVDPMFENPPGELSCIGTGVYPYMFKIREDEILYLTNLSLYFEDGDLKGEDDLEVRYNVIDEDLQSLTGGEEVFISAPEKTLSQWLHFMDYLSLFEFDKKGNSIFLFVFKHHDPIIKFLLEEGVPTYAWTFDDNINAEAGNAYSIRGDGRGGVYTAGFSEEREESCLEIDACCLMERDACTTSLRVQLLDGEGHGVYSEDASVVERYSSISQPGEFSGHWNPFPVFSRSIDNEPDGDAIYFWRKPLVHEGSGWPDIFSYDLGYVLCAQKATRDMPASWGQGGCTPVAQVLTGSFDDDHDAWCVAIDDGEGGAIVVFNDFNRREERFYIRAQKISSSGRLLWDDQRDP